MTSDKMTTLAPLSTAPNGNMWLRIARPQSIGHSPISEVARLDFTPDSWKINAKASQT
jgi:hypothetical protein